jgi:hypothetical protein
MWVMRFARSGLLGVILLTACGRVGYQAEDATIIDDASTTDASNTPDANSDAAMVTGPAPTTLVYSEGIGDLVARTWNGGELGWSAPQAVGSDAGIVSWVVALSAPTTAERMVAAFSTSGLSVYHAESNDWQSDLVQPLAVANPARRPFDLAYQQASGNAMLVYADNLGSLSYRTRTELGWSDPAPVTTPTSEVEWVDLFSHPTSDEVTLLYADVDSVLTATVWDGSAWSTTQLLESSLRIRDWQNFAGAYESASGDFLAVWGRIASDSMVWTTRSAAAQNFDPPTADSGVFRFFGTARFASKPGTDVIALSYLEHNSSGGADQDFLVATWASNGWLDRANLDSDIGGNGYEPNTGAMPTAVNWIGTSNTAVAVYPDDPSTGLNVATWTTTTGWTREPTVVTMPATTDQVSYEAVSLPEDEALLLLYVDPSGLLWSKYFDGATWVDTEGGTPLGGPLSRLNGVAFSVATR